MHDDLLNSPDSTNGSPTTGAKTQKKIHQVSQSDNPTKITIKTFEVPSNQYQERASRKRRQKEFQSPNSESRILVISHDGQSSHDGQQQGSGSKATNTGHHSGVDHNIGGLSSTASSSATASTSSSGGQHNKPTSVEVHDHNSAAAPTPGSSTGGNSAADSRLPMCSITISFDLNTQKLWDDLHLPYETYTSFFRHLILLEKYFRNGDLVLSESASTKASSYIRSLQNRIEEFEVKHKRSHAELSASTRPDLSVPPVPSMLHLPPPIVEASPPPPPTTRHKSADR